MEYKRNCPTCKKEITYSLKGNFKKATDKNTKCNSCKQKGESNPIHNCAIHPMKGKHHSPESKQKISETRIQKFKEGTLIAWLKGKHYPEELKKKMSHTTEEFLQRCKEIHGYRYDYSKSIYKNNKEKIEMVCSEHGSFWQTPNSHLRGAGCSTCQTSHGELEVIKWLENKGIQYKHNHRFKDCRNKNPLPFDFYLPIHNILIEVDGLQHYKPECRVGHGHHKTTKEDYERLQLNDKIKNEFCKLKGIKLIRTPYRNYKDKKNIIPILESSLKLY